MKLFDKYAMPALQIPHSNEKISSLLTTNLKLSRRKRNIKKSNTGSMLRKISIDVLINKYQKKLLLLVILKV
jgi:hypothetical protein